MKTIEIDVLNNNFKVMLEVVGKVTVGQTVSIKDNLYTVEEIKASNLDEPQLRAFWSQSLKLKRVKDCVTAKVMYNPENQVVSAIYVNRN